MTGPFFVGLTLARLVPPVALVYVATDPTAVDLSIWEDRGDRFPGWVDPW